MRFISHRGNLYGPDKDNENKPEQILKAIQLGYDVEIDIWANLVDGYIELKLGHDFPQYRLPKDFLEQNYSKLWIHCKNSLAFESMLFKKSCFNSFWHTSEDFVLTTFGYCWVYPNKTLLSNSIAVLPEICNYTFTELAKTSGICSDSIVYYRQQIMTMR